jgi:hypothetical protein
MVWIGAHYAQMLGVDGFSINEFHTADWPKKPMKKFDAYTPVAFGQYPAAALVYREQALQEAEPVLTVTRTPQQLYHLEGVPVWDDMNLDEMRRAEVVGGGEQHERTLSPAAWFTGPVHIRIADETAPPQAADVERWIDREEKVVRSRTGELSWNWGQGLATGDAPTVQSACGFLGEVGTVDLPQVKIDLDNHYGAVWLVSMDGRPVAESDRLLLQVMTRQRIGGRVTEPATFEKDGERFEGRRILKTGKGPMEVEVVDGTASLKRPDAEALEVVALDFNGYKREVLPGSAASIDLLPDCLYYIIRRK